MDIEQAEIIFNAIPAFTERGVRPQQVSFHSQSLFPIYRLVASDEKSYAIKQIDTVLMAESELQSLKFFFDRQCKVPTPYGTTEIDGKFYLIMDFIEERGQISDAKQLVNTLLPLYHIQSKQWGWPEDNFIGSLYQKNQLFDDFIDFWWSGRIEPLVIQAREKGYLDRNHIRSIEHIVTRLADKWDLGRIGPRLIHGDLWSGNAIAAKNGGVFLIDPSIAFSHPEQDIAMTRMFGGFPHKGWIEVLQKELDLSEDLEERIPYWQIYPVLVHIILFGGSYSGSLNSIILKYS